LISGIVFIVTLLVVEMSEAALDVPPCSAWIFTMGMAKKNIHTPHPIIGKNKENSSKSDSLKVKTTGISSCFSALRF
jgi:hypothetical protein